jgi:hypothetical protein
MQRPWLLPFAVALASVPVLGLALAGCSDASPKHSARNAAMQAAVESSIERMAYLEAPSAPAVSNVQCVAPSSSAMTCVGYRAGGSIQTSYIVAVDDTTGKYIVTSSASRQVETGSESSHPSPTSAGPRPAITLDGKPVSGLGPVFITESTSITLAASVVPRDAALTISGLAATPTTAGYGYHPINVNNGRFTVTLPVAMGISAFQISHGSEVIVTFAVKRSK